MNGSKYTPSHRPVGFDLYTVKDADHWPILFIETNAVGDMLELAVSNTSDKTIQISAPTAPNDQASAENYHLQLRFRNKVLADSFIASTLKQSLSQLTDWSSWNGPDPDPTKREYVISLVRKGTTLSVNKDESFSLPIAGVSAEPRGGARNTRVEIRYDNFTYADRTAVPRGFQQQHLEIVNRIGLKTIPLVAGFTGSSTVLNDGTPGNSRTIFIKNPSREHAITLSATTPTTQFLLQMPVQDPEIKGTQSASANLRADTGAGFKLIPSSVESAGVLEWTVAPASKTSLDPGKEIAIEITNWKSSFPDGTGNLYLHYQNIPGYQDSTFVLPVEYGPLVMQGGKVGIGTATPGAKLEVSGDTKVTGGLTVVSSKEGLNGLIISAGKQGTEKSKGFLIRADQYAVGTRFSVDFDGNVGIGTDPDQPGAKLHVGGDTIMAGDLNVGGEGNHSIKVRHINGKMHTSAESDNLYLNWNTGKDVHIGGATDAGGKPANLIVHGRIKDQSGYVMPVGAILPYGGSSVPEGWLLCDGQYLPADHPQYQDLRAVVGDHVPDLRSRFIVGAGQGQGNDNDPNKKLRDYPLKTKGGSEEHTLSIEQMPSHYHSFTAYKADLNHAGDANESQLKDDSDGKFSYYTDWTGDSKPHNNLPPYYALTYIIKY